MMKFAVTTSAPDIDQTIPISLLSGTFIERIKMASNLGYDGIELITNHPELINPSKIVSTIRNNNLEIAALATGGLAFIEKLTLLSSQSEIEKEAFDRLSKLIVFAHSVSAPIVTIGSFRGKAYHSDIQESREKLAGILYRASNQAEDLGVRLVIEPLNRYEANLINNVKEGLEFISEVGSSNLGLLLDTYHINIEESSVSECFITAENAHRLWHVHLGDSNRHPLGLGHLDFPTILNTLENIQFKDFLSAELLSIPNPNAAAAITIEYLRSQTVDFYK